MIKEIRIPLRGYTKKDGDFWVVYCIDLNIAGHGKTPDEAFVTCSELINEYLSYVCTQYPDNIDSYIPRLAPDDVLAEYNLLVARSLKPRSARLRGIPARGVPLRFDIDPYESRACTA